MRHSWGMMAAMMISFAACSEYEPIDQKHVTLPSHDDSYAVENVVFEAPTIKKGEDDPETRSTLVPIGDKVRFAWEATDTVGIYPDRGSQVFFSMEGGVGTNVANFEGGGWALRQNSTYTSYYPFIGNMYLDREKIPVSFLGQEQNGVSNYDNTRFILASEGTSSEQGTLRFSYEMLNTIIMVNATLPAGNYTKMSLIADEPVFMAEGSFSLKDRAITGSTYTKELVVTLNDIALEEESTIQLYLTEAPVDLRGKDITVRFFTSDGKFYSCVKSPSKAYDAGTWYGLNCVVAEDEVECPTSADDLHTPLTLEAITDGRISIENPLVLTIEYFKNNTWNETSETQITIPVTTGEAISFRGNNKTYASLTRYTNIRTTSDCYLYGNMMSLVSSDNYYTLSSVSENSFRNLFSGAELITNHPKRKILLSATSLAERCYDSMFLGCSYLTEAPELPATILAERCYNSMFLGCSYLTEAPELPATILAERCYDSMFRGCTSLTQAPVLPATTLAEGCYYGMFQECNNLSVAPALPSITLCQSCYAYMFYGCLNLKKAPVLPAFFLASNCYSYMFYDCLNLDYISVAFVSSKIYPTENWLAGVSFTGTFVKNSAATWDVADLNIPKGWDIEINDFGLPDSYIDNRALFGESGSYIELDNLFKNYSSIDHVFLDIANATWDDGLGGRQKLPRTIILIQTEAGKQESIDPLDGSPIYLPKNNLGFLTYRNNKTNLINDYNIYMNAILYFENGNTTTTEIVIPVLFTNP